MSCDAVYRESPEPTSLQAPRTSRPAPPPVGAHRPHTPRLTSQHHLHAPRHNSRPPLLGCTPAPCRSLPAPVAAPPLSSSLVIPKLLPLQAPCRWSSSCYAPRQAPLPLSSAVEQRCRSWASCTLVRRPGPSSRSHG
jgi:hypothetical protein